MIRMILRNSHADEHQGETTKRLRGHEQQRSSPESRYSRQRLAYIHVKRDLAGHRSKQGVSLASDKDVR